MNKNTLLSFSTLCGVALISVPLFAEIKLPAIFGNNMVLQQQTDVALWGIADVNATVEVITSWNDKIYGTKAADDGRFKLKITTPKAGGPYTVKITDGKALTLENVLIGEVWVCSGQSNMQMPMKGYNNQPVLGAMDAVLESNNPNLRLFNVGMSFSITPQEDFKGKWDISNPETTHGYSATAYFFATKNSLVFMIIGKKANIMPQNLIRQLLKKLLKKLIAIFLVWILQGKKTENSS